MKYRVTDAAKQDVREIVNYIRFVQNSPQNARLVAERLKAQFAKLVEMPNLGHVREELADDHAMVVAITGLLVIYDPWLEPLTILRVVHAARHLGRINPRSEAASGPSLRYRNLHVDEVSRKHPAVNNFFGRSAARGGSRYFPAVAFDSVAPLTNLSQASFVGGKSAK